MNFLGKMSVDDQRSSVNGNQKPKVPNLLLPAFMRKLTIKGTEIKEMHNGYGWEGKSEPGYFTPGYDVVYEMVSDHYIIVAKQQHSAGIVTQTNKYVLEPGTDEAFVRSRCLEILKERLGIK